MLRYLSSIASTADARVQRGVSGNGVIGVAIAIAVIVLYIQWFFSLVRLGDNQLPGIREPNT